MTTTINTITAVGLKLINSSEYTTPSSSVAGQTETFEADIQAADGKWFIEIINESDSNDVTVALLPGDYVGAAHKELGTLAAGDTALIYADSTACKANGKIQLSITPASNIAMNVSGIKLHAVQFLPVVNH